MLWPRIFDLGVEITFAHAPFLWSNAGKRASAGVTCAIVGLARLARQGRQLSVLGWPTRCAKHINPYLGPRRQTTSSSSGVKAVA